MAEVEEEHVHPGPGQYVEIAAILALLTTIEVGIYVFREGIPYGVIVTTLLVLTAVKFTLVGLWFMHLRFDHKLFRRLFFTGMALAAGIFAVVLANFYLKPETGF